MSKTKNSTSINICICINTALMFTNFQIVLVISLCCIFRCRIPRTKTEIEANSRRKSLLKNFNTKLGQLKAAELDDMNYRNGEYFLTKSFIYIVVCFIYTKYYITVTVYFFNKVVNIIGITRLLCYYLIISLCVKCSIFLHCCSYQGGEE